MNNDTQPSRDDLADRIMDLALSEKAGGKLPPDLSAQILARADEQVSLPENRRGARPAPTYGSYTPIAVSVCMLALALLSAVLMRPDLATSVARRAFSPTDGDLLRTYEEELNIRAEFERKLGTGPDRLLTPNAEIVAKIREEVLDVLVESRIKMRTSAESSKYDLKLLLENVVRAQDLDGTLRQRMIDMIEGELPMVHRREYEQAQLRTENREGRALVADRQLSIEERAEIQNQLGRLVEDFNDLVDQQRYAEAEILAKDAEKLDPDSPITESLIWKSRFVRRIEAQMAIRDKKERGFYAAMESVDSASVPFDDRAAIAFGDAQRWSELSKQRKKYQSHDAARNRAMADKTRTDRFMFGVGVNSDAGVTGQIADASKYKTQLDTRGIKVEYQPYSETPVLGMAVARQGNVEAKIIGALADPTSIDFDKTPLKDAVDYLKDLHGIEIQIDEKALKTVGVATDNPVSYNVKGSSLGSSLNTLLDGFGLTYQIKNEVLQITTPEAAGFRVLKINGEVTAVAANGKLVEISLGSDDGLQAGRVLNAIADDGTVLLGGLRVLKTSPDRAVAQLVVASDRPIAKGLKVSGKIFDLPPEPEIVPEPAPAAEPDPSGDKFDLLPENDFEKVKEAPLSTFSIDVDTASYSKVRQFLMQANQLPPGEAVRLEELVNYFPYDYSPPKDDKPFAAHVETAACPWNGEHRLVRIGLKGKLIEAAERPACNLVFLVDVSGSMDEPNKLPLVTHGLKMLAGELTDRDRVSIVVYAGAAGMVLPPTRGDARPTIYTALSELKAGGSTNGGEGIELAYKTCQENFVEGGVNRVILCTDGDFNVGLTSTGSLVDLAKEKAQKGVFLSVLGFGMGNHNDEMLEAVSNKANGNHAFIDSLSEARKVLVRQISGTLVTIAKDVKIQVDFNPEQVASYRLLGYENRMLAAEDFADDKKDAGEIGGGHTVTALYEIVPAETRRASEDKKPKLFTLRLRYKQPDGDTSSLLEFPIEDSGKRFGEASGDFQFAASVASFGMILRKSKHAGDATLASIAEIAAAVKGPDPHGYRAEFVELVKKAGELSK